MPERLPLFATCSKGTEELLADELKELGAQRVKQDRGGVRFSANPLESLRVLFHTRIAMRLLWPLAEGEAIGAEGLYDAAKEVPWEDHLDTHTTFAVDATLKDSEHKHSGFVALKVKDAIVDRLRDKLGGRPDVDTRHPDVRVMVHLNKKQLSLSLDLAGEPLNRRGYRVEQTQAPMKETLAAAVLRAAGYTGEEPLADPMCGSGTLVLEAAMIAMRRPPGLNHSFAVERWPAWEEMADKQLGELRAEAKANERVPPFILLGRDREPEAIAACKANAKAGRFGQVVHFEEADAMTAPPPSGAPGLIVSNPPYGDRLTAGGQKGMKTFYFKLSEALSQWHGWRMSFLCGNPAFESAFHKKPTARRKLFNGPLECQQYSYPQNPPSGT
ncbi:MAG: THUMP domain-containing protein [Myxococcaceae bacterium]